MSRHPLEEYFDITFNDISLLKTALTHSSYSNENGGSNNERLEFVGDAVVDLLVGEYLYRTIPEMEGTLTKRRANIVCEKSLSHYASLFHLEDYLLLGRGEEKTGGRHKDAIKCDLFEAFIGAIYIDQGLDACRKVINKIIIPNLEYAYEETVDYKTTLQEYVQSEKRILKYELIGEVGEQHNKTFEFRVVMDNDIVLGIGKGKSHLEAEQAAAKAALDKLVVK
ncbi:MAG: ribonuclease III [Gammaproteobacteria bacterium]|nr:ribonuclease III [Gammaproteobacteria bacterium]